MLYYKCIDLFVPIILQVVKRATHGSDVSYADSTSASAAGTKRSVRDRLGSNVDSSVSRGSERNNKRCVSCFRSFVFLVHCGDLVIWLLFFSAQIGCLCIVSCMDN